MVPVDHVAALVAAASRAPFIGSPGNGGETGTGVTEGRGMPVLHVTARPLPTYNGLIGAVRAYG